ncbi:hypothetical protein Pint_07089 [Pistacia integerrima]|uniref:Uncharacterized protein n=1 Tax=Pistacia integerrima TaxID=434235 RepID=A0ACC0XVD8_9ROSI|nr:hypothetical protein Pint_07089 [Pistacia integerrima]
MQHNGLDHELAIGHFVYTFASACTALKYRGLEEFQVVVRCSCTASLIQGCAFQVLPAPVQDEVQQLQHHQVSIMPICCCSISQLPLSGDVLLVCMLG